MQRLLQLWLGLLVSLASLALGPIVAKRAYADDTGDGLEVSDSVQFDTGQLVVCWKPDSRRSRDILVHFHGAPSALQESFLRGRLNAVLVVVTFPGLSRAYSEPFQNDKQLFNKILAQAMATARRESTQADTTGTEKEWRRIWLSSFSAGYGSVREILKSPEAFDQIDGIVAADSIYAGIDDSTGRREVNPRNMQDFLRFAELAAKGQNTFVLSHSALRTPYASTVETADYLIGNLHLRRKPDTSIQQPKLKQTSRAAKGRFTVLGFSGTTGPDHMQHLHNIELFWNELARGTRRD